MVVREAVAWNRSFAERIAAADRDRTLRLARGQRCSRSQVTSSIILFRHLDLERATLHEDLETTAAGSLRPTLSADERRRRDALLEQYAFGSERLVEGANGALEVIAAPGAAHTTDPPLLGDRNTNAERVHLAQQEQRRQAKAEHEQRVERDRQLLDDQRRKQERAKERTQKREKRRM